MVCLDLEYKAAVDAIATEKARYNLDEDVSFSPRQLNPKPNPNLREDRELV